MIIALSGKKQSGKDTVAKIIQYLIYTHDHNCGDWNDFNTHYDSYYKARSLWQTKQFAGKLKEIVCLLTGCSISDLEKEDFKNSFIGPDWIRYGYADGFSKKYIGNGEMGEPVMNNKQCSKEVYEYEKSVNWQTAYKHEFTYRGLLQVLGTDIVRNISEAVWINALFVDYKPAVSNNPWYEDKGIYDVTEDDELQHPSMYPNWIITDCRFPNELQAVKDRNGLTIRIDRYICPVCNESENIHVNYDMSTNVTVESILCNECGNLTEYSKHPSETALDNATFDYIIVNEGTIEELIEKVKAILIKEQLI